MTRLPLQGKNDSEYFEVTTQADSPSASSVNHALIAMAQEVAELLKQAYPVQLARYRNLDRDCTTTLPHTAVLD